MTRQPLSCDDGGYAGPTGCICWIECDGVERGSTELMKRCMSSVNMCIAEEIGIGGVPNRDKTSTDRMGSMKSRRVEALQ